jgi:hypothetical protein
LIILDPALEVLVVSTGGVGTSVLSESLGRYRRTNDFRDLDGLKHLPVPPLGGNREARVIYVLGDPVASVVSLFRRQYHSGQSYKLQYCRLFRRTLPMSATLEEYVHAGRDRFYFEEHYRAWCETFRTRPTLVVKYDSLWQHLSAIQEFAQVPEDFVRSFPAFRPRESQVGAEDGLIARGLTEMYASYQTHIEKLPDLQILPPLAPKVNPWWCYRAYWIGLLRDGRTHGLAAFRHAGVRR